VGDRWYGHSFVGMWALALVVIVAACAGLYGIGYWITGGGIG
jgi:hypothetical protein